MDRLSLSHTRRHSARARRLLRHGSRVMAMLLGGLATAVMGPFERAGAQDFTANISDADLAEAQHIMRKCLGGNLPALYIDRHSARRYDDYLDFAVTFGWHQESPRRSVQYVARLHRLDTQPDWEPYSITANIEERLGDAPPINVEGWIEPGEVEEIAAFIDNSWHEHISIGEVEINRISSSARPAYQCDYEGLKKGTATPHYTVMFSNSDFARGRAGVASAATHFVMRLVRDMKRDLSIRAVQCEIPCHPAVQADLERLLESSDALLEEQNRRNAALAALPPDFPDAKIVTERESYADENEIFEAHLGDVSTDEGRTIDSFVRCTRQIDPGAKWKCKHVIESIRQTVPGQAFPVRVEGRILPALVVQYHVENLAAQLRADKSIPAWENIVVLSLNQSPDMLYGTASVGQRILVIAIDEDSGTINIVRSTDATGSE